MSPGLASTRLPATIALPTERRTYCRFPVRLSLRFKLSGHQRIPLEGLGNTLNLSTGGVLFSAGQSLPVGSDAELSIEWPASRADCPFRLQLTIVGTVLRSSETGTAVRIAQWEFHAVGPGASG